MRLRLAAKLMWTWILILILVTFASSEVDFVYRGF
jgi:hypothetical protein